MGGELVTGKGRELKDKIMGYLLEIICVSYGQRILFSVGAWLYGH